MFPLKCDKIALIFPFSNHLVHFLFNWIRENTLSELLGMQMTKRSKKNSFKVLSLQLKFVRIEFTAHLATTRPAPFGFISAISFYYFHLLFVNLSWEWRRHMQIPATWSLNLFIAIGKKKRKEIKQFSARNLTILNNLKGNAHIENISLKKGASRLY